MGVAAGLWITLLLVGVGQYQWAYTMMMAGLGLVGAFIGGAGLSGAVRNMMSKRK